MKFFKKHKISGDLAVEAAGLIGLRASAQAKLKRKQVAAVEAGKDAAGPEFVAMKLDIDAMGSTIDELKRQIAELLITERQAEHNTLPELQRKYDSAFDENLKEAGSALARAIRLLQSVRRPGVQRLASELREAYGKVAEKGMIGEAFCSTFVAGMNEPAQDLEDLHSLKAHIRKVKQGRSVMADPGLLKHWAENRADELIREVNQNAD